MNSSYSERAVPQVIPVDALMYRDVASPLQLAVESENVETLQDDREVLRFSEQEYEELVTAARLEAVAETEGRVAAVAQAKTDEQAARISRAIELFAVERKEYFSRVESDVVHLALAIAAKVLHRESQVDPMLIAGLVRVAIEKLHDGSSVSVRIAPMEAEKWRKHLAKPLNGSTIRVVEDERLGEGDCVLETELGSASFSIDAQLKEVEQGFFDLLAQRPVIK